MKKDGSLGKVFIKYHSRQSLPYKRHDHISEFVPPGIFTGSLEESILEYGQFFAPCRVFLRTIDGDDHSVSNHISLLSHRVLEKVVADLPLMDQIKFMRACPERIPDVLKVLQRSFSDLKIENVDRPLNTAELVHQHEGGNKFEIDCRHVTQDNVNERGLGAIFLKKDSRQPDLVVGPMICWGFNDIDGIAGPYDLSRQICAMTRQALFEAMFKPENLIQVSEFPFFVTQTLANNKQRSQEDFLPSLLRYFPRSAFCLYVKDKLLALCFETRKNPYENNGVSYNLTLKKRVDDERVRYSDIGTFTVKSALIDTHAMEPFAASLKAVFNDVINSTSGRYGKQHDFSAGFFIDNSTNRREIPELISLNVDWLRLVTLNLPRGVSVYDLKHLIIDDVTRFFNPETIASIHAAAQGGIPSLSLPNALSIHTCFKEYNVVTMWGKILFGAGDNTGGQHFFERFPNIWPVSYFSKRQGSNLETVVKGYHSELTNMISDREGIDALNLFMNRQNINVFFEVTNVRTRQNANTVLLDKEPAIFNQHLKKGTLPCIVEGDAGCQFTSILKDPNEPHKLPFVEQFCGLLCVNSAPESGSQFPYLTKAREHVKALNSAIESVFVSVQWKDPGGKLVLEMGPLEFYNRDDFIQQLYDCFPTQRLDVMNRILLDVCNATPLEGIPADFSSGEWGQNLFDALFS